MKVTEFEPLPVNPVRPVVDPKFTMPLVTDSVTVSNPEELASESVMVSVLKLAALKTSAVSSSMVCMPGTAETGASFTAVTLNLNVLGDWSRSTPPFAIPPLSRTWKVKVPNALPLLLSAGVNVSVEI